MTQTDLSGPPPEIIAPPPPPSSSTPRNASAGPSKPTKKKRPNLRDGEEIVGQTGADGEEIRFDASDEEVADLVAPSGSRGRAGSTTSSVGAKSNASNAGGGGGERPRSTSTAAVAAVGAGVVGRKAPSVGASGTAAAAEKEKEKEKEGGLSGEMSDDEDLPEVGAIGR